MASGCKCDRPFPAFPDIWPGDLFISPRPSLLHSPTSTSHFTLPSFSLSLFGLLPLCRGDFPFILSLLCLLHPLSVVRILTFTVPQCLSLVITGPSLHLHCSTVSHLYIAAVAPCHIPSYTNNTLHPPCVIHYLVHPHTTFKTLFNLIPPSQEPKSLHLHSSPT